MKNDIKLFALLIFSVGIFAFACGSNEAVNSNANSAPAVDIQTYKSVGVIKAIKTDEGKITIDHEDIPGYMSAMEMEETVADKSLLDSVKRGDKVEFELERTDAKIVLTKLTKIGEVALINGDEIFKTNCAECHGATGEGARKGISLVLGHALHHSEEEYIEQVNNGEGKKMPAFKDKLTKEQISAVAKFVREDLQKDARQNEKSGVDERHEYHH